MTQLRRLAAIAAIFCSATALAVPVEITFDPTPTLCANAEPAGRMTGIDFRWDRESRTARGDYWQKIYHPSTPCEKRPRRTAGGYEYSRAFLTGEFDLAAHERGDPYILEMDPGVWYVTASARYLGSKWSRQSNELRIEVGEPPPINPPPEPVDSCIDSGTCIELAASLVTVSVTSSPIIVELGEDGVDKEFQLVEYGGSLPSLTEAGVNGPFWTFTPPRSGLFYVRARRCTDCDWVTSLDSGKLFYIKLATPTGGSIQ